jgi:hypothetical protein
MRTKTLLLAAAAIAVGTAISMAQTYSQNIVGYVNMNCNAGFTTLANPLDGMNSDGTTNNSVTNILVNVLNNTIGNGPLDNSQLYVWSGTSYHVYLFDANPADAAAQSQAFTGITDSFGNFVPAPTIGNGIGFYLRYSQITGFPTNYTTTVVGTVRGVGTAGITNTVTIAASPVTTLVASGSPVAGGLLTDLQLTNALAQGLLDGDQIQIPNVNASGNIQGYKIYLFDSSPADAAAENQVFTGITDSNGNFVPQPTILSGGSFLFQNFNNAAVPWTQTIPLQ